jgi:dihydroneopterin triphosphate diphosphatase
VARTPVNVLVLPFRHRGDVTVEHAIFRRADADSANPFWQSVAGGVEDGETRIEAANRELAEETGLSAPPEQWIALETRGSIPATVFGTWRSWGPETYVVHQHAFGVEVSEADNVTLSQEHSEFRWLEFEAAIVLLRYDSDRTALWELNERLARRKQR